MTKTVYDKDEPGMWQSKTVELLKNRPRTLTLEQIAADTKIDIAWLWKFSAGKIKGPSVNRVEVLRNYLLSKSV